MLHFISGLPRSGSTLLAAILKQNPRFHAGMTSPVAGIFRAIEDNTARRVETSVFVSERQREDLLRGIFDIYYRDEKGEIIFDTSRMWCARMPLLVRLFPKARIIACVREIGWIMDSFERLYRANNQTPSAIYGWDTGGTVWTRSTALANSGGIVGYALDALREACASDEKDRMMLIDYEDLCKKPKETLRKIYAFTGEKEFQHDFARIEYEAGEFDIQLGAKGLHTVRERVAWKPRKTVLPPDLFARFNNDNFWKNGTVLKAVANA